MCSIISLFQNILKQLFTSVSVASSGYLPRRFASPRLISTTVNNCYLPTVFRYARRAPLLNYCQRNVIFFWLNLSCASFSILAEVADTYKRKYGIYGITADINYLFFCSQLFFGSVERNHRLLGKRFCFVDSGKHFSNISQSLALYCVLACF